MNNHSRPQFSDVETWGVTHRGKVRTENMDHFFMGSLTRGVMVDQASITENEGGTLHQERLATLAVVADGVGGYTGGEEAARRAVEELVLSVSTLFLGLWPHAYLLQVGDSRCYVCRDGQMTQISRDQTLAQEFVDQGVMTRTKAEKSQWANVLSSAVGGKQAEPVVTRAVRDWGTTVLLCSDGLDQACFRRTHPRSVDVHDQLPPGG